ncbi:peptidase inhibitor family I36 protein [Amycolatopsis sp. SID8362]|uniref:peptidase inhibitor family I36 protein n=1 Tax=Amycolatopsis sp. SID8362 TaxID=2690346 RepID=UPI001369933A|nr:peptidase inhibitor family I36 protein [Amycolatopsis sp. SID8362]NBH12453.1 hypothetical protein [Amycolatopsis sp. SID8362]NED49145.1 peptidase inhibitor family I36 protein [Amycolatopsis sp. SID8362]
MKPVRSLLVTLGLALIPLAVPAAAQAQPAGTAGTESFNDCPAGYFCVWENADGTGRRAQFQLGSPNLVAPVGGYIYNDKISSVSNRTSRIWCLYEDSDYQGNSLRIGVGWKGPIGPRYNFNDKVSSLRAC